MIRTPAFFASALVALLSGVSAGCAASMVSAREVNSPKGAPGGSSVLVGPAPRDIRNVFLPAVLVVTTIFDGEDVQTMGCSGALVRPTVVVTAGHCVCRFRDPMPSDNLPTQKSSKPDAGAVVTRARALEGVTVTGILDSRSPCGKYPVVATLVYGNPGEKPEPKSYSGTVVLHPDIEVIAGAKEGLSWVVWNHADLAIIRLDRPVPSSFQPLRLPASEVKLGDALVITGYGPAVGDEPYGARRFGENVVTEIRRYETGNVIFGAAAPPRPDGGVPALARPGDSGGACVSQADPNVLLGIVSTWERSGTGGEMSIFTSLFPHRDWLNQYIPGPAADAGVPPPPPPAAP